MSTDTANDMMAAIGGEPTLDELMARVELSDDDIRLIIERHREQRVVWEAKQKEKE